MRKTHFVESWVVYQAIVNGQAVGPKMMCEQAEWAALELARPGANQLIKSGITNEGEAERLARGTAGDPVPRAVRPGTYSPTAAAK